VHWKMPATLGKAVSVSPLRLSMRLHQRRLSLLFSRARADIPPQAFLVNECSNHPGRMPTISICKAHAMGPSTPRSRALWRHHLACHGCGPGERNRACGGCLSIHPGLLPGCNRAGHAVARRALLRPSCPGGLGLTVPVRAAASVSAQRLSKALAVAHHIHSLSAGFGGQPMDGATNGITAPIALFAGAS